MNLVNQRRSEPERRKIKLSDLEMPFLDLMAWLQRNPDAKEHFDECIYWGDEPLHSFGTSLPDYLRVDEKPAPPGEATLIGDLDYQMSDWAQDLLSMYWDKVDISGIEDPAERERIQDNAIASKLARDSIRKDLGVWAERRLEIHFNELETPENVFPVHDWHPDGASEVLTRSLEKQPFIQADLESELSSLFNASSKKNG